MKTNRKILFWGIILIILTISLSFYYFFVNRIGDTIFIKTYEEIGVINPYDDSIHLFYITDNDNIEKLHGLTIHSKNEGDFNINPNITTMYSDNLYKLIKLSFPPEFIVNYNNIIFNEIDIQFEKADGQIVNKNVDIGEIAIINRINEEYSEDNNIEFNYGDTNKLYSINEAIKIESIEEYINSQIADIKIDNENYKDIVGKEYNIGKLPVSIDIKDNNSEIHLNKRIHYINEHGEKNFIDIKYHRIYNDIFNMDQKSIKEYIEKVGEI